VQGVVLRLPGERLQSLRVFLAAVSFHAGELTDGWKLGEKIQGSGDGRPRNTSLPTSVLPAFGKYHHDFEVGILANAMVGGPRRHRRIIGQEPRRASARSCATGGPW
jgi:hypothetical protein